MHYFHLMQKQKPRIIISTFDLSVDQNLDGLDLFLQFSLCNS